MQLIGVMAQVAASKQAASAHQASGEAQAQSYRDQAKQAESKAKDEELQRLQKLRLALSSQRAHWAAAGIDSSTGTPTTLAGIVLIVTSKFKPTSMLVAVLASVIAPLEGVASFITDESARTRQS